jgi:hypothetical protein
MPFTEVPAAHLSEEYDSILAEKGSTMLSPWRHLPFLLLVLTASTLVTSTWLRPADEQAHWLVESAARPSQFSDPRLLGHAGLANSTWWNLRMK